MAERNPRMQVLDLLISHYRETGQGLEPHAIAEKLGLSGGEVQKVLRYLEGKGLARSGTWTPQGIVWSEPPAPPEEPPC